MDASFEQSLEREARGPVMARSESLVSRTWHGFGADHCTRLAAAIAYYVLFSFIPLVTLLLAVFGFLMRDPQSQQDAVDRLLQTLPFQASQGQNLIFDSIRSISNQSGALSLIGIVGLIWSSSGMFGAIRHSLNVVWHAERQRGFVAQRLFDVVAMFGLGILLVASMTGTILNHQTQALGLQSGTVVSATLRTGLTVMGVVLPAAISFVGFLLLYGKVPNVRHRMRDVWPGALLATALFELGKHGFAYYVSHFNRYQAVYGVLGGVMLFMLWTYLAAIILLIGAEFASEIEERRRPRPFPEESPAPPSPFAPREARA